MEGTHEYATVNGVMLHYVVQGEGQVMLFLHGFPEFWYAWKHQLAEFGTDHRAIALDMRGYNLSDKPAKVEEYAVPVLVEDIRAFLEAASPGRRAILVAHDWGGVLASVYAARYPDTLDKLIIINAPHPTLFMRELQSNPKQQKASSYMALFRSRLAETVLSAFNYAMLAAIVFKTHRPDAFTDEDKRAYRSAWSQPGALTGGLNYYRAADLAPRSGDREPKAGSNEASLSEPPLPVIQTPTLVLWGEKDVALLLGNLEGLDKEVQNLTIKRFPTAGHWIVHEEPDTVNRAIREFLQPGRSSP